MDDIIAELISILSTGMTTSLKKYFYGQNLVPEQSIFPFLEVVPISTQITNRGTGGTKNNVFSVSVNIKDTIKANFTSNTNKSEFSSLRNIVKLMEERDTDGDFKTTTVLGVLTNNLKLNSKVDIEDNWNIQYDSFTLNGSYIIIGTVTFDLKLLTVNS